MEDYSRRRHEQAGYEFVYTPHITKAELFETSGHLSWYKDGMFPPMHMDEQRNEAGEITKQGADYYLKPMNCPFHILIFHRASVRIVSCLCDCSSLERCTATKRAVLCTG